MKVLILLVAGLTWTFGFYGWYIPDYIEENSSKQEEVIEMVGMVPIKQVEISGWSGIATWKVITHDSLGSPIEKLVDVRLYRGNWILQPH